MGRRRHAPAITSLVPFRALADKPAYALIASATSFFLSNRLMLSMTSVFFHATEPSSAPPISLGLVSMQGYTTFKSRPLASAGHVCATIPLVKLELTAMASAKLMLHCSSASNGTRYRRFHHFARPWTSRRSGKWQ